MFEEELYNPVFIDIDKFNTKLLPDDDEKKIVSYTIVDTPRPPPPTNSPRPPTNNPPPPVVVTLAMPRHRSSNWLYERVIIPSLVTSFCGIIGIIVFTVLYASKQTVI